MRSGVVVAISCAVALMLLPQSVAGAQSPAPHSEVAPRGPLQSAASVAFRPTEDRAVRLVAVSPYAEPTPAPVVQGRRDQGRVLAIVGGAAFLAGLVIGDDIGTAIAVGGVGIGLYGLYLWMQ